MKDFNELTHLSRDMNEVESDKNSSHIRKAAFTSPSRGMSEAKGEQESTETLSFRCDCERCRFMRGRIYFVTYSLLKDGNLPLVPAKNPSLAFNQQTCTDDACGVTELGRNYFYRFACDFHCTLFECFF